MVRFLLSSVSSFRKLTLCLLFSAKGNACWDWQQKLQIIIVAVRSCSSEYQRAALTTFFFPSSPSSSRSFSTSGSASSSPLSSTPSTLTSSCHPTLTAKTNSPTAVRRTSLNGKKRLRRGPATVASRELLRATTAEFSAAIAVVVKRGVQPGEGASSERVSQSCGSRSAVLELRLVR
jgi:hypothetical protein